MVQFVVAHINLEHLNRLALRCNYKASIKEQVGCELCEFSIHIKRYNQNNSMFIGRN